MKVRMATPQDASAIARIYEPYVRDTVISFETAPPNVLDRSIHRRGHGRQVYTALLNLLGAQGYINSYAAIALPNPASVALHEALGFKPVGVFSGVGFKNGT
jgi:L-amino acid N-acyltransferase YncA